MGEAAKRDLRAALGRLRARADPGERARADAALLEHLARDRIWRDARTVCIYLSFASEVDTRALAELAWKEKKRVCAPRCAHAARSLTWHALASPLGIERGARGAPEPPDSVPVIEPPRARDGAPDARRATDWLAVVPGLAFDARGFRLGYGGGYYDRFLASFAGVSVGLCRRGQLLDSLGELGAVGAHDVPVDFIATPSGVRRARGA